MKTWDDWSDLEINQKVAEALSINFEVISGVVIASVKHGGSNVISISGAVDYCNSWTDMGPIIDDNDITVGPCTSGRKMAASYRGGFNDIVFFDNKTCRAAAIVFLMMNGVSEHGTL